MTTPADALARLLELTVLLDADMASGLAEHDLTPARAHVVWELRGRGPSTQRTIADAVGVTPRNVTGLVDGLVETGFVTREPHPSDRRALLVTLTEKGLRVTERLSRENDAFAEQLFGGMAPERREALHAGLGDVIATIRDLQGRAADAEPGAS